jgi:hypothetical protein
VAGEVGTSLSSLERTSSVALPPTRLIFPPLFSFVEYLSLLSHLQSQRHTATRYRRPTIASIPCELKAACETGDVKSARES